MITPYRIGLLALMLIAASSGYLFHQATTQSQASIASEPAGAPLAVSGMNVSAETPPPPQQPRDWAFSDLDGQLTPLSQWDAPILVVNFWATWCPPCLREIPAFVELQEEFGEHGVQFLGIALDQREAVEDFLATREMNYPTLLGDDDVIRFMQTLGNEVGGLPYTSVIGIHGEVLLTRQGEWHAEDARATLMGLTQSEAAAGP